MSIRLKQKGNILIMEFESNALAVSIRRDFEFNKRLKETLKRYWKQLGYDIEFIVEFNHKTNTYELRSKDLVNGLPKKGLTGSVRNRLIL